MEHNKRLIRQDSCAISCLCMMCFTSSRLYSNERHSTDDMLLLLSCFCLYHVPVWETILKQKQNRFRLSIYSGILVIFVAVCYSPAFLCSHICLMWGTVQVTPLKNIFPMRFSVLPYNCVKNVLCSQFLFTTAGRRDVCQHEIKVFFFLSGLLKKKKKKILKWPLCTFN